MDVTVDRAAGGEGWTLKNLLGRSMGTVVEEPP
jgi:hypothetical protein